MSYSWSGTTWRWRTSARNDRRFGSFFDRLTTCLLGQITEEGYGERTNRLLAPMSSPFAPALNRSLTAAGNSMSAVGDRIARSGDERRVVFVGYSNDSTAHDGFAYRYRHLCETISATHNLLVMHPPSLQPPPVRGGRSAQYFWRLALHYLRGPALDPSERRFREELSDLAPDLVVSPAYMGLGCTRSFTSAAPSLVLLEENVLRTPEHMTKSRIARAKSALRNALERSWAAPPSIAVVINGREVPWARRILPRSRFAVIPLTIDFSYWEEDVEPRDTRIDVLCVNAMSERRNADGLAAIVRELKRLMRGDAPTIHLVSAYEPHAVLAGAIDGGDVKFLGTVDDVRPLYRAASCCLVPSFVAPGTKTTILQGWATGCPVVTTTDAAGSVGCRHGQALLAGSTPADVATMVAMMCRDEQIRRALAEAGHARLMSHHGSAVVSRRIDDVVALGLSGAMLARHPLHDLLVGLWANLRSSCQRPSGEVQ
jgi:glycosyltransferase involved in cell wall biosynthesis